MRDLQRNHDHDGDEQRQIRATRRRLRWALTATAIALPAVAVASPVAIPNAFVPNTVISSSEINENFSAVETAVNDNDSRISALEANAALDDCVWARTNCPNTNTCSATCPANTYAISGGCSTSTLGITLRYSGPGPAPSSGDPPTVPTKWWCDWNQAGSLSLYALCCSL